MLYEILCDKFINKKEPRGRIPFNIGLNVVQGHNSGENSIGKSSFLLAIDFAFGGKDYANDSKIINHIGHHTIKFCFEFSGNKHYFSRYTGSIDVVNECDENYNILNEIKLTDFLSFLFLEYKIELNSISFRDIIGRYFRVYGKPNLNEKLPLASYIGEPEEDSLIALIKLYNKYSPIAEHYKEIKLKKGSKDAIFNANKYNVLKLITTQKAYNENLKKIENLQVKLDELTTRGRDELLTIDPDQSEKAAEIKSHFDSLTKQKRILWTKYYAIKKSSDFRRPATIEDFNELIKYFPNSDIRKLEEIENFHKQLASILNNEFNYAMSEILKQINNISEELVIVENEMKDINLPQRISENTLKTYSNINNEIKQITEENKLYLQKKELDADVKTANLKYINVFMSQIEYLKIQINEKMQELNTFIYDEETASPVLSVLKPNAYEFGTTVDGGTGTNFKNLVLLDLATLESTPLPALAHDTVVFKHIAQKPMGKIIELYEKYTKQTFIAIDETTKYPEVAQEIIESKTVLKLSSGGSELYGESWVKRKKEAVQIGVNDEN